MRTFLSEVSPRRRQCEAAAYVGRYGDGTHMVDGVEFAFVLEDQNLITQATNLGRAPWLVQEDLGGRGAVVFWNVEYLAACLHGVVAVMAWAGIGQRASVVARHVHKGRGQTGTEPSIANTRAREWGEEG